MSYRAPEDVRTQARTKSGWLSLLWMFVGSIITVMIGVFVYLSPLFDGFRQPVEANAPIEVQPLPQQTPKQEYDFYEVLPKRKFQGSDSGLGNAPSAEEQAVPATPKVQRKHEVDAVVVAPKAEQITVVEEDATYDDPQESAKTNTTQEVKVSKSDTTYILQIRSYENPDDADRKLAEVMMAGVDAKVVERKDSSGAVLYQVITTPIANKEKAHYFEQKLSEQGIDSILVEQRH